MKALVVLLALVLPATFLLAMDRREFARNAEVVQTPWGVAVTWTVVRTDCDVQVRGWHALLAEDGRSLEQMELLPVVTWPGLSSPLMPWPARVLLRSDPLEPDEIVGAVLTAVCNPVQAVLPVAWRPIAVAEPTALRPFPSSPLPRSTETAPCRPDLPEGPS